MCERITKKYTCNRCSNDIFVGDPQQTFCKYHRWERPCGRLEQIDIVKCEPALCIRCSSFPADGPLPFSGTPDVPPLPDHEVERRCEAHIIGEKKVLMVRIDAVTKARKTYLVGDVSGQEKRDKIRNAQLGARLARVLPEMKMIEPKTDQPKTDE